MRLRKILKHIDSYKTIQLLVKDKNNYEVVYEGFPESVPYSWTEYFLDTDLNGEAISCLVDKNNDVYFAIYIKK
jgi:hypothetical protein